MNQIKKKHHWHETWEIEAQGIVMGRVKRKIYLGYW